VKLGVCAFFQWGDDVVDRPDNTDELTTASLMHWWVTNRGKVYYYDDRVKDYDTVFHSSPTFYQHSMRESVFRSMRNEGNPQGLISIVSPGAGFPEIDALVVRWRWDTGRDEDEYILGRQKDVVTHYISKKTPVYIWDEDFQFDFPDWISKEDYDNIVCPFRIQEGETDGFKSVHHIPLYDEPLKKMLDFEFRFPYNNFGDCKDPTHLITYIGNNYDRDHALSEYILKIALSYPRLVQLYGNWVKYPKAPMFSILATLRKLSRVCLHPKVDKSGIEFIYSKSFFVPMIAKDEYFNVGHMTPRLFEVLCSGAIPIPFTEFFNFKRFYGEFAFANAKHFFDFWGDSWDIFQNQEKYTKMYRYVLNHVIESNIFSVEDFVKGVGL